VYNFEDIKSILKYKGYITGTQISLKLSDPKQIKETLATLEKDPEIHKIEYTNRYVAPYKTKQLYFYNPNIKKKAKRKSKTKKTPPKK
jgi:hypothetical protein